MSPQEIRKLRQREQASVEVFARYLYVTPELVSRWESGKSSPRGAALKLLTLINHNGLSVIA